MIQLKDKILHCLAKYPETRNCDILLTRAIWYEYHNSKGFMHNGKMAHYDDDLIDLPREDHVKRVRATIQNSKSNPRFLPTKENVLRQRKIAEEHWHLAMASDNPSRG